jgi:hypothetical protein
VTNVQGLTRNIGTSTGSRIEQALADMVSLAIITLLTVAAVSKVVTEGSTGLHLHFRVSVRTTRQATAASDDVFTGFSVVGRCNMAETARSKRWTVDTL